MVTFEKLRTEARLAHTSGNLKQAENLYRQLIKAEERVDDIANLGALLRASGRIEEASLFYHAWLPKFSKEKTLVLNACNCWRQQGKLDLCKKILEQGLSDHQGDLDLIQALADTEIDLRNPRTAIDLLIPLLHNPNKRQRALISLGIARSLTGELKEALSNFEEANSKDPTNPVLIANRIIVLKDIGNIKAAKHLRNSLSAEQASCQEIRRANAMLDMHLTHYEAASQAFCKLAQELPGQPEHWLNWAACLQGLKFTCAPLRVIKRGLCWHPNNLDLQQTFARSLGEMGQQESLDKHRKLWKRQCSELSDQHIFSMQFQALGCNQEISAKMANLAREWEKSISHKIISNLNADTIRKPIDGRKLRIGYISADYCNHPVARFLLPILKNHNRDKFTLFGFHTGPFDDWITEHIRNEMDHWFDLNGMSDLQCARLIADQEIDVLVELGGYTANTRLRVLMHRPAAIQLSYLGYPAPTYLRCIDGWIGDKILFQSLNKVNKEAHRLLTCAGGYMVFDPGGELPTPARGNHKKFRFGCFNHSRKLTKQTIDLFCRIMQIIPDAELVLKSINFHECAEQERIRNRFKAAGLDTERLVLLNWVEGGLNHLQKYAEMDVALDPIPYGGATTTAEALWMGVPVVALSGDDMVGRLSASLLHYGNQKGWVARSQNHYIEIAAGLAKEGFRTAEKRKLLRAELEASPLADAQRLSKALESLYDQEASRAHC